MQARGSINSTLVRVYSGLGVIRCYDGEYEAARREFQTARAIAVRIGNEAQQVTLAANLALCCLRLGEYDEQLEWSERAAGAWFSRYQSLQVAYNRAFALAMRGDTKAAYQIFAATDPKIPEDSAPWLFQAWKLHRADILCLCGQRTAAMAQARAAIMWPDPVLYAPSFAGVFARWVALISQEEGVLYNARPILDELGCKPDEFDAVDRAEITCARLIAYDGENSEAHLKAVLAEQLASLPPAVVTHLERLGVLDPRGTREERRLQEHGTKSTPF
jgi:tetratricopeptide (TPR) repeat protein